MSNGLQSCRMGFTRVEGTCVEGLKSCKMGLTRKELASSVTNGLTMRRMGFSRLSRVERA